MRNIGHVVQQMMDVIPPDEPLAIDLEDLAESVRYAAPEMVQLWWRELTFLINEHLPPSLEECNDWQRSVGLILMDRTE